MMKMKKIQLKKNKKKLEPTLLTRKTCDLNLETTITHRK
jgi:hypothetical protein